MKTAQAQTPQSKGPVSAADHEGSAAMMVGSFLSRKWQQIKMALWVLLAILVVGIVVAMVRARRHAQVGRGFADMKKAESVEKLDVIAQDQAGTRVGELASLKTARRLYDEGKYEQAAARFALFCQKYPDSAAAPGARLGEAYALETAGKQGEAGQRFAAVAGAGGDSAGVRDAMCGAARCAAGQGLLAEAETWYKKARDLAGTSAWDKDRIEQALKDLAAKRADSAAVPATGAAAAAAKTEPAGAGTAAVPAPAPATPAGQAAAATPPASAK